MYNNQKPKKNTTDKKITLQMPHTGKLKTQQDLAGIQQFNKQLKAGGKYKAATPNSPASVTFKNPDYQAPSTAKPNSGGGQRRQKLNNQINNNTPVVGAGASRPLDNQNKRKRLKTGKNLLDEMS